MYLEVVWVNLTIEKLALSSTVATKSEFWVACNVAVQKHHLLTGVEFWLVLRTVSVNPATALGSRLRTGAESPVVF